MVREVTERDMDALIGKYIEPAPGDARIGEYRLREEAHGYPVWAVIGSLSPDGSNADEVARDFAIPLEAVEAVRAFYSRHRQTLDDRLAANRAA
jgi:uncharacterized protein (DUF433 family)